LRSIWASLAKEEGKGERKEEGGRRGSWASPEKERKRWKGRGQGRRTRLGLYSRLRLARPRERKDGGRARHGLGLEKLGQIMLLVGFILLFYFLSSSLDPVLD